jgi:hypothetical protein
MVVRREQDKMRAESQSMTTRPSAVAGLFYADDPDRLRTQVLDLLGDVAASTKVMPKALIAPHAGYAYSGREYARPISNRSDSESGGQEFESLRSRQKSNKYKAKYLI